MLNDPINFSDPSGLRADDDGAGDFAKALGLMTAEFFRMSRENTKGNDKYYHCVANCKASSNDIEGALAAEFASNVREVTDQWRKGDAAEMCEQDQIANRAGRKAGAEGMQCAAACGAAFPYKRAN